MCPKTASSYVCIGHSSQNIPLPYTTQTGSWNLVGSTRQLINIYWDSTDFIDEILSSFICGIGAGLYTSIRSCQLFVMACGAAIFCYQTWYLWIFPTFSKKGYEIVISRKNVLCGNSIKQNWDLNVPDSFCVFSLGTGTLIWQRGFVTSRYRSLRQSIT